MLGAVNTAKYSISLEYHKIERNIFSRGEGAIIFNITFRNITKFYILMKRFSEEPIINFLISKISFQSSDIQDNILFIYLILLLESVIFVRLYLIKCVIFFLSVREEMKRNRKLRRERGINCEEQVRSLLLSVGRLRQRQIAAISSALIFSSYPRTWENSLRWIIVKTVVKMTINIFQLRISMHSKY